MSDRKTDFFSLVSEASTLERAAAVQQRLEKAHRLIVNLQRAIGRDFKIGEAASLRAAQALNAALMRMHQDLVEHRQPSGPSGGFL